MRILDAMACATFTDSHLATQKRHLIANLRTRRNPAPSDDDLHAIAGLDTETRQRGVKQNRPSNSIFSNTLGTT
jgi:hypothetical protein